MSPSQHFPFPQTHSSAAPRTPSYPVQYDSLARGSSEAAGDTSVQPTGQGSELVRGDDGGMYLRWEPGLTTTTTTHTTRTVTHFPPLRLPLPPLPPVPSASHASTSSFQVSLPSHLSPTAFPLSQTPTPQDLQFFTLSVGGRRVLFTEDDPRSLSGSGSSSADRVREGWELEGRGKGWTRVRNQDELEAEGWEGLETIGLGSALGALASSSTAGGGSSSNVGQRRTTPLAITPPEPSRPASLRMGKGKERDVLPAPPGVPSPTFHPLATSPSTSRTSRPDPSPASHHPLGQHQRQISTGGSSSPPRKRQRDGGVAAADEADDAADDDAMAVDHPSPTSLAPPAEDPNTTTTTTTTVTQSYPPSSGPPSSVHQPTIGSGLDLALLQSLPHLLKSFDALPPKLADHFLLHCLRRSTLPTLQRVSSFISPALKFDFVLHFPAEIAIAIFSFLPRSGLANAARVSRRWNEMVDCQRGIWVARLEHDGLWWGLGADEEEEEKVRHRWEVKDRLEDEARREEEKERPLGTPQETSGSQPSSSWNALNHPSGSEGRKRRSHPLKQVYRMRYMTKKNWTRPKPAGRRFMFHGHGAHVVTCLQFDTDKIVSASDDHSINVYAIKDGAPRCRLDGHEGGVWALEYRGDVLVSGSTDRTVRVWSLEQGKQTHIFWGHTSTVRCLQIVEPVRQPNGEFLPPYPLIVTGSRDSTIRVWRLPSKGEPEYRSTSPDVDPDEPVPPEENPFHNHCLEGHQNAVRAIAAHGRYCVSGSYDCTVRVWDIVKGTCLHVLRGHQQKVYSVVLDTRRGRVASGSMDGTVKIWDLIHGTCLATLEGHVSLVGLLGISPTHLVSAAADSTIKVWDADSLACTQTLTAHTGAITCFQHDETKIVSGSEGTLKLWDVRDGSFVRDLVTGVQGVWQVAFSGRYLVSASNRIGITVPDQIRFDVIDFGDCGYDDGAGDESLDALVVPEWERSNRLEPRTYQDDQDAMGGDRTFSSPATTNGGGSGRLRRTRIQSGDLSSPEGDEPWGTHLSSTSFAHPPPSTTGATTASGEDDQPPFTTPHRGPFAYSATQPPPAVETYDRLRSPQPGPVHYTPVGRPPAATSNASPSVDRRAGSTTAFVSGSSRSAPRTRVGPSGSGSWTSASKSSTEETELQERVRAMQARKEAGRLKMLDFEARKRDERSSQPPRRGDNSAPAENEYEPLPMEEEEGDGGDDMDHEDEVRPTSEDV